MDFLDIFKKHDKTHGCIAAYNSYTSLVIKKKYQPVLQSS